MQLQVLAVMVGRVVLAAAAGEGVIEFLVMPLLKLLIKKQDIRTYVCNILSGGLGVLLAWNFRLGVFALAGAPGQIVVIDYVITGILIGRGSNYVHDFVKKFLTEPDFPVEAIKA